MWPKFDLLTNICQSMEYFNKRGYWPHSTKSLVAWENNLIKFFLYKTTKFFCWKSNLSIKLLLLKSSRANWLGYSVFIVNIKTVWKFPTLLAIKANSSFIQHSYQSFEKLSLELKTNKDLKNCWRGIKQFILIFLEILGGSTKCFNCVPT